MRVVIQRVLEASCTVDGNVTGRIGEGYCIFAGFCDTDTNTILDKMVKKITQLRIFEDAQGKMNQNIQQVNGAILSISQFTLYAACKKGNRPGFTDAARPSLAIELYKSFNEKLAQVVPVATGIFGADMKISLINNGPVTIVLDSEELFG